MTFTGHLALQHYLVRKVNGAIDFEFIPRGSRPCLFVTAMVARLAPILLFNIGLYKPRKCV
ncbi:hypothetical protein CQP30_11110 [Yersinia pestis]|uniref:Uncharacterized protein n=2 Tax=Yersinia pseudotuberculosis complex TaxID=1649845 RepID=A0ABM7AJ63_YERPU|nr:MULTISPECIES: hypothetical protein [Yersinia pseudotuberculosis complex]EFA49121.1 conserved hypothetical protein [Yersinia pestis KIM D27]ANW14880.1 hypothetical protein BAY22_13275 [Yersinia pestis]AXY33916.1 hypothetical protein CEQ20_11135 [Yersinia pseudotuberculosis]AYW82225.1 hypothetical protein EGX42_04175 [Yersinia pestis]AYW87305.1 hypothetical protein EGX87_08975 [Yersinia pseudotuberculosis]